MAGPFKMKGSPMARNFGISPMKKPTSTKNKIKAAIKVGTTRLSEFFDTSPSGRRNESLQSEKSKRYSNQELYKDYKKQLTKGGKARVSDLPYKK